jgi:hypothetical protein
MMRYITMVVLLAACTPAVTPPLPDGSVPVPTVSSVPVPVPPNLTQDCAGACTVLASYGCPEANGVDGGDSCVVTCNRAQGGLFDMKPLCIVNNSSTIANVRMCGTVTCPGVSGVRKGR